jgi:hypothetical protein
MSPPQTPLLRLLGALSLLLLLLLHYRGAFCCLFPSHMGLFRTFFCYY